MSTNKSMITTKFVRQFQNLVQSVALEHENDPQKREDLVQDIWLEICKSAGILPKDEAAYSTWVFEIATRTCKRHAKGEASEPEVVNDSALTPTIDGETVDGSWIEETAISQYNDPEQDALLDELMYKAASLSEQEAAVFNLVYWHGQSYQAVAQRLGISVDQVGVICNRLRSKFEVKEIHHPVHVYHAPGNVWGDWSWKPENKKNGTTNSNGRHRTSQQ